MYSPARPRTESVHFNLSPASLPQRVSTPIERGSGFNDLLDDSLPECSLLSRQHSYSESSLCDLSFDYTADESKCSMPLRKATSLSDFLVTPTPPSRLVTKRPKSCGRVLTSSENIRQLEEKEEKKRTALKEKGERRKLREESKLQREAEKSAKKIGSRAKKAPLQVKTGRMRGCKTSAVTDTTRVPLKLSYTGSRAGKASESSLQTRRERITETTKTALKGPQNGKASTLQVKTRSQRAARCSAITATETTKDLLKDTKVISRGGANTTSISSRTRSQRRHVRFQDQPVVTCGLATSGANLSAEANSCSAVPQIATNVIDLTGMKYSDTSDSMFDTWIKGPLYSLNCSDRDMILSPTGWFNDSIITAAQSLMLQDFPHMSGLQPSKLQETLSFDVPRSEFVQILHVRNSHWCVLSSVGCEAGVVNVYDTFYSDATVNVITSLVFSSAATLTVRMMDVMRQVNQSDCGILSIAIAYEICSGGDPCSVKFDKSIRKHLAICLEKFKLSCFPQEQRRRKTGVKNIQEFELHCIYRMPHDDSVDWAQCDVCNVWYHAHCMDIPREVIEAPPENEVEWTCKTCKTKD